MFGFLVAQSLRNRLLVLVLAGVLVLAPIPAAISTRSPSRGSTRTGRASKRSAATCS
jgi:gamma-glutamyl:cysteine ligase YbdK (ATP-grasp superfamily)